MIKRVQNAYYVVRDMDRAVGFYRDALGLKLKFQDGAKWAQFGGVNINFSLSAPEESAGADGGAVVVFEADDLPAAIAAVQRAGGTVVARRDMGAHGKTVTIRDPEGNVVQLFGRAAPA
jgi:predicted enzyme related to lactoylglutathione lyase